MQWICRIHVSDLKCSHIVPGENCLECAWNNMNGFDWLRCSIHINYLQIICSWTNSISAAEEGMGKKKKKGEQWEEEQYESKPSIKN